MAFLLLHNYMDFILCYYPYIKDDIFNTERRDGNEK